MPRARDRQSCVDDEDEVWNYTSIKTRFKTSKSAKGDRKKSTKTPNIAQSRQPATCKLSGKHFLPASKCTDNDIDTLEKENHMEYCKLNQDLVQDVADLTKVLAQNASQSQILCQDAPHVSRTGLSSQDTDMSSPTAVMMAHHQNHDAAISDVSHTQNTTNTDPSIDPEKRQSKAKRKSSEMNEIGSEKSVQSQSSKKPKLSTKSKRDKRGSSEKILQTQSQKSSKLSKKNKKQEDQVAVTPRPKREGHCPFCQMPFQALSIESPRWHVGECMDLPLIAKTECPSGLSCDNTIPSHFRKFTHSLLAKHRSGASSNSEVHSAVFSTQSPGTSPMKKCITSERISSTQPSPCPATPQSSIKRWLQSSVEKRTSSSASQIASSSQGSLTGTTSPCFRKESGTEQKVRHVSKHLLPTETTSPYFSKVSRKERTVEDVSKCLFPPTPVTDDKTDCNVSERETCSGVVDAAVIHPPAHELYDNESDDDIFSDGKLEDVIAIDDDSDKDNNSVTQPTCDTKLSDKKTEDSDEIEFCHDVSDMLARACSDNEEGEEEDEEEEIEESKCDNNEQHSLEEILTQCETEETENGMESTQALSDGDDDDEDLITNVDSEVGNVQCDDADAQLEGHDLDDAMLAEMLEDFDAPQPSTSDADMHAPSMKSPHPKLSALQTASSPVSRGWTRKGRKTNQLVPDEKQASILNFITCAKSGQSAGSKQTSMMSFVSSAGPSRVGQNFDSSVGKHPLMRARTQDPPDGNPAGRGTAPAGRGRGRGGSNYGGGFNRNSKCPFYKWIPDTRFTVDAFKYGVIPNCDIYFLSHFHYDHYQGLSKHFQKPVYCSKITSNLVAKRIRVGRQFLHVIPLNTPRMVDGAEVTLLEANHCPGAVLILFKLPNGKTILHTGDFRASRAMEEYPQLQGVAIDELYLDTTYCDPSHAFPPQDEVIKLAVSLATEYLYQHPNTLIVVGSYTIGKERIFLAIAEALNCQIYVTREKLNILECLENDAINKKLSPSAPKSKLHVLPMKQLNYTSLVDYLSKYKAKYDHILAFEPTGWTHSDKSPSLEKLKPKVNRGNITIYGVPYSEHSSYLEMKRFVQFLRPAKILPTVNNGNPQSRRKMEALFKSWLSEPITSPMKQTSISNWFH